MNSFSILLFGVGLFFLTGLYVFIKQGIKSLAVIVFLLAALAITGGILRL